MLKNLPARPKGSAVHRASRSASHPYIRHDQQHLSPSHTLNPQRNCRYNDTSPRKSSDMARSLRTSNHSLRVVSTLHCSTNRQQSSPRHSSRPSRLESKRLDTPFKVEPTEEIFIQESSYRHSTPSTVQAEHLAPPTQVPFRATHAPNEMRKLMSVFRLNPFSIQYGGGGEASSLQWNGQEVGPLTEEPQFIEFQLERTDESIDPDLCKVSQKSDETTATTTTGWTEGNEDLDPLLRSSDWGTNDGWLLQFQSDPSRTEEFAYDELDSTPPLSGKSSNYLKMLKFD